MVRDDRLAEEAGALSGVRVVDAATLYPAPLLAAMLGDLGADVVKVEPPSGDPMRAMGAAWTITGRNKRSIVADLDTDDGRALLHRLLAASDVAVFNQPTSVLERWGCSDEALSSRTPRLIVVHVSCFGSTGPYADRVGNGTLAEAFVGLPQDLGIALGDTLGAIHGVVGALAALHRRERDGRAEVVDVSLYEALLPLLAPAHAGVDPGRTVRERHRAADGREVAVSATTPAQLERLTQLTGTDVGAWIATLSSADAVDQLVAARVPAVGVDEFDPEPRDIAAAPALGEHTSEVVEEWLHGGT